MQQLMGVVNLDHELDLMNELTYFRCGAAVPFAGRYRLIDFVLSNMMHSGVHNIALFVRRKYRSLMDHLGKARHGIWTASMEDYSYCRRIGMIQRTGQKETCSIFITIVIFS